MDFRLFEMCEVLLRILVIMTICTGAKASFYTNGINESTWSSSSSVFECRIVHEIPYFGAAVFRTKAGESSTFFIDGLTSHFKQGEALIVAKTPIWINPQKKENIGYTPVKQGRRPIKLASKTTEQILSDLYGGREIEIIRKAWYAKADKPSVSAVVSNIGFYEEYEKYLGCLGSLLPANFEQLERTSLYFKPVGSTDLTTGSIDKLEHILALIEHDKAIKKFYIDGHASSPGDRASNLELSKSRAEVAANFLINNGVSKDRIIVRWHGERYPIASNNTLAGRAKNRRVTVRLEKSDEAPEMAKNMSK